MATTAPPNTAKTPTQQRAKATQDALLQAATRIFASSGYDSASTRQIEEAAGVKRGLIRYHFGNKETLWKAAVRWIFERSVSEYELAAQRATGSSAVDKLRFYVRAFVRTSAKYPEINRLMIREGMDDDWRMQWLSDNFVEPWYQQLNALFLQANKSGVLARMEFSNFYYILVGAGSLLFSMAPEARRLAGIDTTDEAVINSHAEALTDLLLPQSLEYDTVRPR